MDIDLKVIIPLPNNLKNEAPELIAASYEASMRGFIYGKTAEEFYALLDWYRSIKMRSEGALSERMIDEETVDEVYTAALKGINHYGEGLQKFKHLPNLTIGVIGLDRDDGFVIVRISDGRENVHHQRRKNTPEFHF